MTEEVSKSNIHKRVRSPSRRFVASPSNKNRNKRNFFFSDKSETETHLKRNIFEATSDRFQPSRVDFSLEDTFQLIEADNEEPQPSPSSSPRDFSSSVIGVTGLNNTNNPPTSSSQSSHSPTYQSLLRQSIVTPHRSSQKMPKTPMKLFKFNNTSFEKEKQNSRDVLSSHNFSSPFQYLHRTNFIFTNSPSCSSSHPKKRKINKHPFKILDAPSLKDDYYLNLVDWSSKNILAVGLGSSVYLWNATTTKVSLLADLGEVQVTSVGWSVPDGCTLSVGTSSGKVLLFDGETKHQLRVLDGHSKRVGALAFSFSQLASGSRDLSILRRDIRQRNDVTSELLGHKQEVCGLRWSFDSSSSSSSQLASGGNDNRLVVWDAHKTSALWKFCNFHVAAVKAVAWSPHERGVLASGGGTADRCIKFWNCVTGTNTKSVDTGSQVCNLMWSKSMNEIVSTHGYSLNHMIVWKVPSMQKVATLNGHTFRVLYLAMSPDGQTVVTGAGDERLCFWNLFPPTKSKQKIGHKENLFQHSFQLR